jgi:D-threo-aldose 1-dehydrogenase
VNSGQNVAMRRVALAGTDLTASPLGFGSAALMARLGRRESVRLLEVAHGSGVTHFDTARAYGYGEAESAVGDFLSRHRDAVTVTTKLGIVPPNASRAMRGAKATARAAARIVPGVRPLLRKRAQSMGHTGAFTPEAARASLEMSLRELRIETVDILLLHECRPHDVRTDGLLEFLEQAVKEGKVRYFGVATDRESTAAILVDRPEIARVAQVRQTVADDPFPAPPGVAILTHSAVAPLLRPLAEALRDEGRRRRWSDELGFDCAGPEALGRLLLASALHANPHGVVLFSSTNEQRIRSNAELGERDAFTTDQLRTFARLAREAAGGTEVVSAAR